MTTSSVALAACARARVRDDDARTTKRQVKNFDPVAEAFKVYDPDASGFVDTDVLRTIFESLGFGEITDDGTITSPPTSNRRMPPSPPPQRPAHAVACHHTLEPLAASAAMRAWAVGSAVTSPSPLSPLSFESLRRFVIDLTLLLRRPLSAVAVVLRRRRSPRAACTDLAILIETGDADGDGKISLHDFRQMLEFGKDSAGGESNQDGEDGY